MLAKWMAFAGEQGRCAEDRRTAIYRGAGCAWPRARETFRLSADAEVDPRNLP